MAVAVNCSVKPTVKIAGLAGVISMEDNVKATTVKLTTGLVMSAKAAVILVFPIATLLATPSEDTAAILISELAHFTLEVMSAVVPSAYFPVATNTCEEPTPKISGMAGVTAIDNKAGAGTTFKATTGLALPETVAVMLVLPTLTPVAKPSEDMAAMFVSELTHTTLDVMSLVEPSAYVPVAVNCIVNPTAKLFGVAGVTAIVAKMRVGAGVVVVVGDVDVDEQDAITEVKTTIIPIIKQLINNRICFLFKVTSPFRYIPI
jgi:hypothetical protein